MIEVSLPDSAWEGVDTGVQALLDQWLVAEGDAVTAGQALAKVVLVKASLEVVAPAAGRVQTLHLAAGDTFARGQPIATLESTP
ncbi:lipoyl domain-containing protein [Ideonella sp.]|uniref:lipoyl domain-containing protein n=1 Tax=Ideonella sp. TaxID=1929293 RepID=UPI002B4A9BEA|nr:lipoyl domain-containing protein [Ideonella sp.]HJV71668.1 lipoyl domain-containing protein [Ideonella sp.]